MTRPGLASNGLQSDPDGTYDDPVLEEHADEPMHGRARRLRVLRRHGFGIGKTCAEMPSDIICPTGFSAIDVLSNWGVELGKPGGKKRDLFFRIIGYPKTWQRADDPDETSLTRYHILDDQGRIRMTSLYERKKRCDDGVVRPDTSSRILLELHARFSVTTRVVGTRVLACAWDANNPNESLHEFTRAFNRNATMRARLAVPRKAREDMEAWLETRHPNWRDPREYWDKE